MSSGRRRKIRCVPRPGDTSICTECYSRGTQCRDQQADDLEAQLNDGRPNLRERVARLESQMSAMLSRPQQRNLISVETELGAAETLSHLRSELPLASEPCDRSGMPCDGPSADAWHNTNSAPVLSIFSGSGVGSSGL